MRGGSWGGGRQEGEQPGAPGLGRVLRARGWDSLPSGVLATPAPSTSISSPPLPSLDLFFRWLFDKKFLAEAAIRFE